MHKIAHDVPSALLGCRDSFAWSPDGAAIAYAQYALPRNGVVGGDGLFIYNVANQSSQLIMRVYAFEYLFWRDTDRIVIISLRPDAPEYIVQEVSLSTGIIQTIPVVFPAGATLGCISLAPDRTRFITTFNSTAYLVPLDGQPPQQVTADPRQTVWSSSGTSLFSIEFSPYRQAMITSLNTLNAPVSIHLGAWFDSSQGKNLLSGSLDGQFLLVCDPSKQHTHLYDVGQAVWYDATVLGACPHVIGWQ
jgi:hypothetical protein